MVGSYSSDSTVLHGARGVLVVELPTAHVWRLGASVPPEPCRARHTCVTAALPLPQFNHLLSTTIIPVSGSVHSIKSCISSISSSESPTKIPELAALSRNRTESSSGPTGLLVLIFTQAIGHQRHGPGTYSDVHGQPTYSQAVHRPVDGCTAPFSCALSGF